jgi:hypothetical protein
VFGGGELAHVGADFSEECQGCLDAYTFDGGQVDPGEFEPGSEPVAQTGDGFVEEECEELAALAENASQGLGHGKDELAVRDIETNLVGDPVAGLLDLALVATGAEAAGHAGEGEQLFVAAVGASEAGDAGGEVAKAVELVDDGDGTWFPLAHRALLEEVQSQLDKCGFTVGRESHALSHEGARYFGVMEVRLPDQSERDYAWVVGLRNSHDKSFPEGFVAGTSVFTCDNLAK